jgi:hypothetical protein
MQKYFMQCNAIWMFFSEMDEENPIFWLRIISSSLGSWKKL